MALEKKTLTDKIEVVDVGTHKVLQVRCATWIEEDGVMIGSKGYHRHVVMPTDDLTDECVDVQAIGGVLFTQEMKDAYTASQTEVE